MVGNDTAALRWVWEELSFALNDRVFSYFKMKTLPSRALGFLMRFSGIAVSPVGKLVSGTKRYPRVLLLSQALAGDPQSQTMLGWGAWWGQTRPGHVLESPLGRWWLITHQGPLSHGIWKKASRINQEFIKKASKILKSSGMGLTWNTEECFQVCGHYGCEFGDFLCWKFFCLLFSPPAGEHIQLHPPGCDGCAALFPQLWCQVQGKLSPWPASVLLPSPVPHLSVQ